MKLDVAIVGTTYQPIYKKQDVVSVVHSDKFLGAMDFVFVDAVLLGVGGFWRFGYGTGCIRWRGV